MARERLAEGNVKTTLKIALDYAQKSRERNTQAKVFTDIGEKRGQNWPEKMPIFVLQFPGKVATRNFTENPPQVPRGRKQNSFRARLSELGGGPKL